MRVNKIVTNAGTVLRAELLGQYPDAVFRDEVLKPTGEVIAL